jgi:lysophospholipase L1-like esterase
MMRWSVLLVALLAVSCANQLPTAPSASPAPLTAAPFDPAGIFVTDGNSLTQSRNGAVAMPDYVQAQLGSPPRLAFINAGESGHTTPQMLTTALTLVDPLYRSSGVNVLMAWEGANDLYFGASADAAFAHLREYGAARRHAGFSVFLLTLLPREDMGVPATYERDRQTVNAALRASWPDFATGLIDVAADPIFASPSVVSEGIYISPIDLVHLTDAGSLAIAKIVVAAVRPTLAR